MGKARKKASGSGPQNSRGTDAKGRSKAPWIWALAIVGIGALVVLVVLVAGGGGGVESPDDGAHLQVQVPQLSAGAETGQVAFDAYCSSCHGRNAAGTNEGPPLVHRLYEPSHHGDAAIWRAAQQGVQAHHWDYGNMPRVSASESELRAIIRYVRELQQANGIR